jgi:uncharacterized membrane protein
MEGPLSFLTQRKNRSWASQVVSVGTTIVSNFGVYLGKSAAARHR